VYGQFDQTLHEDHSSRHQHASVSQKVDPRPAATRCNGPSKPNYFKHNYKWKHERGEVAQVAGERNHKEVKANPTQRRV